MAQTISVQTKTIEEILTRLDNLTREIRAIKTELFEKEVPYGSEEWWNKEIKEGLREIRKGKYTVYKNAGSLIEDLHKSK